MYQHILTQLTQSFPILTLKKLLDFLSYLLDISLFVFWVTGA